MTIQASNASSSTEEVAAKTESFKSVLASAIQEASQEMVEEGLSACSKDHQLNRFLSPSHPQFANAGTDYEYSENEAEEAKAYVAASCLTHFGDSWSYFAQAIRAIMVGEFAVAKHLLYYSELRAAFSILARQGILIRSNQHLVLQEDGTVTALTGKGTHEAVWLALKAWMKTAGAKEFFLERTRLGGQPVGEWLDAQQAFENQTMEEIFRAVGYDLKNLSDDRGRRNSASYGARFLSPNASAPMRKWFAPELQQMWNLLDPVGSSGFDKIDSDLAAYMVKGATKRVKRSVKREKYEPYIHALAKSVGSDSPASTTELIVSVAERSATESIVGLALSDHQSEESANSDLLSMVARSFLLARFAASAAEDLIKKSAVPMSSLNFWFASVGSQTGLWSGDTPTKSALDILDAIKDDLLQLADAEDAKDLYEFLDESKSVIHKATNFGIIAVWIRGNFDDELPVSA